MNNSFTPQDLLQALITSALRPEAINSPDGTTYYSDGVAQPLVRKINNMIDNNEEFQELLFEHISSHVEAMAAELCTRVMSQNATWGVGLDRRSYGGGADKLVMADWLREPLGKALSEALRPYFVEHFKENLPNLENANITITVEMAK